MFKWGTGPTKGMVVRTRQRKVLRCTFGVKNAPTKSTGKRQRTYVKKFCNCEAKIGITEYEVFDDSFFRVHCVIM